MITERRAEIVNTALNNGTLHVAVCMVNGQPAVALGCVGDRHIITRHMSSVDAARAQARKLVTMCQAGSAPTITKGQGWVLRPRSDEGLRWSAKLHMAVPVPAGKAA